LSILEQVKPLAQEYYRLTGKPLGVTAEIGEFEVHRLLGVDLCVARQAGYDAIRSTPYGNTKLSIKTVCFPVGREAQWKIGDIGLKKDWDATLMVLLTPDLEPREIWEADKASLETLFPNGGKAEPSVRKFKAVGKKLWPVAPN